MNNENHGFVRSHPIAMVHKHKGDSWEKQQTWQSSLGMQCRWFCFLRHNVTLVLSQNSSQCDLEILG